MKYCPQCGNKYPNDLAYCTVDGSPLSATSQEAETLKMEPIESLIDSSPVYTYEQRDVFIEEYINFVTPKFILRIVVKDVLEAELPDGAFAPQTQLAVQLEIDSDRPMPAIIHGGERTKKLGLNRYLVPVAASNQDESRSLYFFDLSEKKTVLFRLLSYI